MNVQEPTTPKDEATRRLALGIAGALAIGALGGYALGAASAGAEESVGSAYSTEAQIAVRLGDSTYEVPPDAPWKDDNGSWRFDGSRPECLPPVGDVAEVRVATVPVDVGGLATRQVVAVFCGGR